MVKWGPYQQWRAENGYRTFFFDGRWHVYVRPWPQGEMDRLLCAQNRYHGNLSSR